MQTCGNYDADSCLEWGGDYACASGEQCSDGACVGIAGTCLCAGSCQGDSCYVVTKQNNCNSGYFANCIYSNDPPVTCPGYTTICPTQMSVAGCECLSTITCADNEKSCTSLPCCDTNSYCSSGYCCPRNWTWSSIRNVCIQHTACYPNPCPVKPNPLTVNWLTNLLCVSPVSMQACCFLGSMYGVDEWYDEITITLLP